MTNSHSKEAKLEENRLSALPDSILLHILPFLPVYDAVQTLLIRRFGTLWTSLPNLEFDDSLLTRLWLRHDDVNTHFFQFVHNVLTLHQRPTLDKFRLEIYQDIDDTDDWDHEKDSWLTFALRKQVKVLEFGFGMVEPEVGIYKLPFSEFISTSLVELKLVYIEMEHQTRVQMDSLRVLKLIDVSLSDKVFSEIIRGCPLLKELEISNCWDLSEVNSSSLEKLKVDTDFNMMRINCPKLVKFFYRGCVKGLKIINLSSLVDLTFQLQNTGQEFSNFTEFESLLTKLLQAKIVSLSSESVTGRK